MKNTLKCNITGAERVTNVPYLTKKADRLGISVEDYKQFYVTKAALGDLKAEIATDGLETVANALDVPFGTLRKFVNYNGKNKYVPTPVVVQEDGPSDDEETEFAGGELTTA